MSEKNKTELDNAFLTLKNEYKDNSTETIFKINTVKELIKKLSSSVNTKKYSNSLKKIEGFLKKSTKYNSYVEKEISKRIGKPY
ncbi:hypothetical protein [uncultured archaeal virus]|uniref:Uncharacterized protein n=1 Tax=uncultured archaeal virus TaxID=1960247 RepID=A0A8B0LSE0_9VIRU|nr:hypothetical protein [uncultured archaeal virus]